MEGCDGAWHNQRMPTAPFHCPHCGALYEKTDTKVIARDKERVVCAVCRNIMYESSGARIPAFKLIKRPEGDTQ